MSRPSIQTKVLSLFLAVCTVFSFAAVLWTPSYAAPSLPKANSQPRHVVCTTLSASAQSYYIGSYTYENLAKLSGASNVSTSSLAAQNNTLYSSLQTLMTSTHTFQTSYSGTSAGSLAYYWQRTDAVSGSSSFVLFYSDTTSGNSSFNREHVWPKSNASFKESGGGSDLHHLRPTNPTVNSTRGNLPFGNVRSKGGSYTTGNCYWKTSSLFETRDNIKGDVARILLYVYVRWGEKNIYSDVGSYKKIIESLDTLLEWCASDPVDTWEMERNDLIQQVQGNRNVFIDYPELAFKLFNKEIPAGMTTPSGQTCTNHVWQITSHTDPSCTEDGVTVYTCTKCGVTRTEYEQANGHNEKREVVSVADCTTAGVTEYVCTVCGNRRTQTTPALGHLLGAGTVTQDPSCTAEGVMEQICSRCGITVQSAVAPLGHDYDSGAVTTPPDCENAGVATYTCLRCGDTYTQPVSPLGHDYDSGVVTTPPDCENAGVTTYTCLRCGATYTTPAEPLGHIDENTDGVCDRCGAEVETAIRLQHVTEVEEGMHLVIYHPAQSMALSRTASDSRLAGVAAIVQQNELSVPDGAAVFVVHLFEDGFYLVSDGKYLTTSATGNSLSLAESADDYSLWRLEAAANTGLVYLFNVNAQYGGKHEQALEYYQGVYTVYGVKYNDAYQYELYGTGGHVWSAGVVTEEPSYGREGTMTCTCLLCGETKEEVIPALQKMRGDMDDDGVRTILDVTMLLNVIRGMPAQDREIADVNADSVVNIRDVTELLNLIAQAKT